MHAKDRDDRCLGANKAFGIIVLMLGDLQTHNRYYLSNPGLNCAVETQECRVMVCLTTNGLFGRMSGCAAHMTNTDDDLAKTQANDFRAMSASYAPSSLVWMGGDFNLTPTQVPSGWNNHRRLNVGPTADPTDPPADTQIDYIYHRDPTVGRTLLPAFCPIDASDHCLVEAEHF